MLAFLETELLTFPYPAPSTHYTCGGCEAVIRQRQTYWLDAGSC